MPEQRMKTTLIICSLKTLSKALEWIITIRNRNSHLGGPSLEVLELTRRWTEGKQMIFSLRRSK